MKPDPKIQRHVQRLRDNLPYDLDIVSPPPPGVEPTGTDPTDQPPPADEHDEGDEPPTQWLQRAGAKPPRTTTPNRKE